MIWYKSEAWRRTTRLSMPSLKPLRQTALENHKFKCQYWANLSRIVNPRIPRIDIEWTRFGDKHAFDGCNFRAIHGRLEPGVIAVDDLAHTASAWLCGCSYGCS